MKKRILNMFLFGVVALVLAACAAPDSSDILDSDLDKIEQSPCVCVPLEFNKGHPVLRG